MPRSGISPAGAGMEACPLSEISLLVGGDLCPIGRSERLPAAGPRALEEAVGGVGKLARASDLFIANLECPLDVGTEIAKCGASLVAKPESIEVLKAMGVGLVTLANNHIGDQGEVGLNATLNLLHEAGLPAVGAGRSSAEAAQIMYRAIEGRTVACVAMAERETGYARGSMGGANPFDPIAAVEAMRQARQSADHVVFLLHGGLEGTHYPSPDSVRVLRFLAEQGATAIIRHHPHSVQGHEVWNGVPIFYSLGNLLFDWPGHPMDEAWHEGILVELRIGADDRCSWAVHPFTQCLDQPGVRLLEGNAKTAFMERFEEWARVIADPATLQERWAETLEARKSGYLAALALPHPWWIRVVRKLGLIGLARPGRAKRMILENYLRCDAHREAVTAVLEGMADGRGDRGSDG